MSEIMRLISMLILLESGGNDSAVGKGGELGCLQIKSCVVADVNEWYGTSYVQEEMVERPKAVAVFRLYLSRWVPWYERRTGKRATFEVMRSLWQKGPKGTTGEF